jgi:hypothetical protein
MKNLEEILNKYFNSGSDADLPDISTAKFIKVNSSDDGFNGVYHGGHIYVIEKDSSNNYAIYSAHNAKNKAILNKKHEPQQEHGLYLDDAPVVLSRDNAVYFTQRTERSSYDIAKRTAMFKTEAGKNILYNVLGAFVAFAYSVYKFSNAYATLVTPPIEIGTFEAEQPVPTPSAPTPQNAKPDEAETKAPSDSSQA